MTQEHPITPPLELVQQWWKATPIQFEESDPDPTFLLATRAAQWGADQELEACVAWLDGFDREGWAAEQLRADRRPKPSSLKEQALTELGEWERVMDIPPDSPIRRALEQLPDPS